jgi:hypothetical protein
VSFPSPVPAVHHVCELSASDAVPLPVVLTTPDAASSDFVE